MTKSRLVYLLGIVFGIVILSSLIIPAFAFDYKLRGWLWGVLFPVIFFIVVIGVIALITRLRKKQGDLSIEKIREIPAEEHIAFMKDRLIEIHGNMVKDLAGERIEHKGSSDTGKTPNIHLWGIPKYKDRGSFVHYIANMTNTNKRNLFFSEHEVLIDINKMIEQLAENPEIEETTERIITEDEFTGKPVTKKVPKKEKIKIEEEKQREEEEKL